MKKYNVIYADPPWRYKVWSGEMCIRDRLKAGNAEFRRAAEQTRAALDAMHLPELDYFIEHCMESFSMTLDELE